MLRLNIMEETQPGSIGLRLLAVVVLVVANAFFVAAEFALVSARRTRIEEAWMGHRSWCVLSGG